MNAICMMLAAAVVANGGFEQGGTGWRIGAKTCRVTDGAGLRGSKGLVWRNDDPAVYSYATQDLPLEPGRAYAFGGYVKDGGVTNATCRGRLTNISVEMRDTSGKFLGMVGAHPVVDNQRREDGWVKLGAVTPVMPADLGGATLVASALRGSTGQVTFDDFEVTPLAVEPIPSIVSSAYRDVAVSGAVTFVARCILNPHRDPIDSVATRFRFVGTGGEFVRTAKLAADGTVRVATDVAALAFGTHPVEIELKRPDGRVIATRRMDFTRAGRLPARKVAFDAFGRTLVDGRPFFPIGLYSSRNEVDELDTYCEGPFNCILPYALPPDPQALEPYAAKGLKVIVCVSDFTGFRGSKLKGALDERAYAARYLHAMKNHPAVLAWYLADELPPEKANDLRMRNLQFRAEDPDHPTFVVFDHKDRPADFIEGYDIVGMDPYPIGNGGGRTRLATCSTFPEAAWKGMYGFRAMWQVPQTFDWGWERPWAVKEQGAHMPTGAELRNMNWQAIASGANGLVGWWFPGLIRALKKAGKTAEFAQAWGDVKAAYAEVAAKVPLLLSAEPAPRVARLPPNVSARTWRKDGVLWLLAVNRTYDPVSGTVTLSDGRSVAVSLEGLGFRFMKLSEFAR